MIRIEIIANHSVEENILEAMQHEGVGKFYTKYPGVYGVGSAGPRMGDAIWPEENFSLVIWCDEEEARGIARAVAAVKGHFPGEGIKLFGISEDGQTGAGRAVHDAARTAPSLAESPPDTAPYPNPAVQAPPRKGQRTPYEDGPEDPNAE
ncbi:MAG: hypothetical protein LBB98_00530 [Treponema sp.]|jgi:hypothetical protein|nr:hypothetical protein [Treponema sp.]